MAFLPATEPALVRPGAEQRLSSKGGHMALLGRGRGGHLVVLRYVVSYGVGDFPFLTVTSFLPGPLLEPPSVSTRPHQALPSCHPLHAPPSQR